MPNTAFPVADNPLPVGHEALRRAVDKGLAARKSGATASEISRLVKTLQRLEEAARNVPPKDIAAFAASGTASFDAVLRAAA